MSSPPVRMLAVPQAESATRARIVAVLLRVALDQQLRRFPAELPGRRRRHRAGVDRIEIAPGRQHLGPAAARRARRAGRHEAAVEPGEQAGDLGRRRRRRRPGAGRCVDPVEHGAGLPVQRRRRRAQRLAARPSARCARRLQPLDRVAGACATAPSPASAAGRGPGPRRGEIGGRADRSRARDRRPARAAARPAAGAAPRGRRASATSRSVERVALGRAAEDVQPVADLQLLQLAEIGVELAQAPSPRSSPAAMPQSRSRPARAHAARGSARGEQLRRGADRRRAAS